MTGGLRLAKSSGQPRKRASACSHDNAEGEMSSTTPRRLESNDRSFPQRKKRCHSPVHIMQPTTTEKFITGIFSQLHDNSSVSFMSEVSRVEADGLSGMILMIFFIMV